MSTTPEANNIVAVRKQIRDKRILKRMPKHTLAHAAALLREHKMKSGFISPTARVDLMLEARAERRYRTAVRKANAQKSAANLVLARAVKANGTVSRRTKNQRASMRGHRIGFTRFDGAGKPTPCKVARNVDGYRPFLLNRNTHNKHLRRSLRYALSLGEAQGFVSLGQAKDFVLGDKLIDAPYRYKFINQC